MEIYLIVIIFILLVVIVGLVRARPAPLDENEPYYSRPLQGGWNGEQIRGRTLQVPDEGGESVDQEYIRRYGKDG